MKKITTLALAIGATVSLAPIARCDEIEFRTPPQPVQTTVLRETHIANPSSVRHVIRSDNGIYEVTVRENAGERVVYVNPEGAIVQAPSSTTTRTTVQRPVSEGTVTYEQIQQNQPRYQLLEKKGKKEIYLDRQTGQKVKMERERLDK
jgi:hypothetical protein